MAATSDDRSSLWEKIEQLARELARDSDLAEEFERTPGKVIRRLGIPADAVPHVLATMAGTRAHEAPTLPNPPQPDDRAPGETVG